MPIVASAIIRADFRSDGLVKLLSSDISKCGCISLLTESKKRNISIKKTREIFDGMDGVKCSEKKCCITDMQKFSNMLKKFRD